MTKDEYIKIVEDQRKKIVDKYSHFFYYILRDVYDVNKIEKIVESYGYTTKRKVTQPYIVTSEIFYNEKLIGYINTQEGPNIEFCKGNKKHADIIAQCKDVIEPIKGVHRVLEWHTVKRKLHVLARGEIVLHFKPYVIPDEFIDDFFKERPNLIPLIQETKDQELLMFEKSKKNNGII